MPNANARRMNCRKFSAILKRLANCQPKASKPTMHALPLQNVLREDVARAGLSRDAALQNAPEHAEGMFQVPRVVEAD
jgi:aspartyl-tRNA(Asn)/glutamyl-tRNA(Gln) amidotransferase subunit C